MSKGNKSKVKSEVLPHSQAKLDLYKHYLSTFLNVISSSPHFKRINLFDIYSGVGLYSDGNIGSPLITNNCIRETNQTMVRFRKPLTSISVNINDYDKEKIQNVKSLLDKQRLGNCSYEFFNLDAEEMLDIVAKKVNEAARNERNLVFIDPYGYSQIHSEKIYSLIKNDRTEVILFLPVMQMYRFSEAAVTDQEDRASYENLKKFIFSFFPDGHKIHTQKLENVFEFIHEIKLALAYGGKYYTCSHHIEREKGNYYALFFITANIYGLEKMVEAKWHLDPVKGKGFDQKKDLGQQGLFDDHFEEEDTNMRLDNLRKILMGNLEGGRVLDNTDVYRIALLNEFKPKQAKDVLENLLTCQYIRAMDKDGQQAKKLEGFDYKHHKDQNKIVYLKKISYGTIKH